MDYLTTMKTLINKLSKPGGQLVSSEVTIGNNVLSIRAKKRWVLPLIYVIYVQNEDRYFEHSRSRDLQNIMADFIRLVADYRRMMSSNNSK